MKLWRKSGDLSTVIREKQIPIVTLDERWHTLFGRQTKSANVQALERKLNDLIKQQGRLVNEAKDLKAAKNRLMNGIVANMDVNDTPAGKLNQTKLQKSKKLIVDVNEKIKDVDNALEQIPYRIWETNAQLVAEGIRQCYETFEANSDELETLQKKIQTMREELQQMIDKKLVIEEENTMLYTNMHSIVGPEVMEEIDHLYRKRK